MKKLFKRRDPKKFDLKVAANVRHISEKNGKSHHLLLTKHLSNQGAYFNAIADFAFVGPVEVEVVRRKATGLAVRFRGESSLKHFCL